MVGTSKGGAGKEDTGVKQNRIHILIFAFWETQIMGTRNGRGWGRDEGWRGSEGWINEVCE